MCVAVAVERVLHERLIEAAVHAAATNNRVKILWRDAYFGAECKRLGVKRTIAKRQEIIEQLHLMAITNAADMHNFARPSFQHGFEAGKNFGFSANHRVQSSGPGFLGCSAQRCVSIVHTQCR